jgi:hypothetical protein
MTLRARWDRVHHNTKLGLLAACWVGVAIGLGSVAEKQRIINANNATQMEKGNFICQQDADISVHYVGVTHVAPSANGGIIVTIDGYKRLRYEPKPGEMCPLFVVPDADLPGTTQAPQQPPRRNMEYSS